eukprot:2730659-Alexandrium_andersonii.AAC.1
MARTSGGESAKAWRLDPKRQLRKASVTMWVLVLCGMKTSDIWKVHHGERCNSHDKVAEDANHDISTH